LYVALLVVVLARSAHNWREADMFERIQLAPAYTFALATFALAAISQAPTARCSGGRRSRPRS
jgi:hypothetical protein